jgi:hypothetical protein
MDVWNSVFSMATRAEREAWAPAFTKLGIQKDEVFKMSATEFINRRDYLEFEGFGPGPLPEIDETKMEQAILRAIKAKAQLGREQPQPGPRTVAVNPRSAVRAVAANRALQEQQDREYADLVRQTEEQQKLSVQRPSPVIPPEPADGLLLAVMLPNRERKARKFDPKWKAQTVFDWIAVDQTQLDPRQIILREPTGKTLDPEKTLEEQAIVPRTLLTVLVK